MPMSMVQRFSIVPNISHCFVIFGIDRLLWSISFTSFARVWNSIVFSRSRFRNKHALIQSWAVYRLIGPTRDVPVCMC